MENFDEQPLDRAPGAELPVSQPRPTPRGPVLIIAVVGILLGGAAAWWWMRSQQNATPAPATTTASEAAISETPEAARPLPPLGQMDTFLRALLATLSSHPDLARWLATDDLIRQMANGIDRISRGQSPAADLQVLRPAGDFAVTGRRQAWTISPDSFGRYDRFAALVQSLDARGVVGAYRTIQPRLDEAYRALGRSEGGVDAALDVALQTLIDTPIPKTPVALVQGKGATYAYRDPALERLSPVQKQLLRMGPDNMRVIQTRLREIRAELISSDKRVR
jgi:hypothetical protein